MEIQNFIGDSKKYLDINTSQHNLTDFIHQIISTTSIEELADVVRAIRIHFGFDFCAIYARVPRAGKSPLAFFFREYEDDWTRHYESNHYMFCDPAIRLSETSVCPFVWSSHLFEKITPLLKPNEIKISYDAYDFGLKEIFNAPFRSENGSYGLIRFINKRNGQSSDESPSVSINKTPEHYYLASCIYESLIALLSQSDSNKILSNREIDILTFIAQGKTPTHVADYLKISENTVRKHLSNIRGKLEVRNITHAVSKAIFEKIIHL